MVDVKNSFDGLPDEVFQLIFVAVEDCKSLVRCMAVSKAFKEQSSRVSSLSINCPGQFSSYDQKLRGIYTMVKEFHSLESLIVRVGQPKDEPPSWARCMRYVELGASVEKFVFMAAKSGDFSEFDCALGGPQFAREFDRDGMTNAGGIMDQQQYVLESETAGIRNGGSTGQRSELEERENTTESSNLGLDLQLEVNNPEIFSLRGANGLDASSSTLLPRLGQPTNDNIPARRILAVQNERAEEGLPDGGETIEILGGDGITAGILVPGPGVSNSMVFDRSRLSFERGDFIQESQRLPEFNLRQVIAPSNDVLKRMVPVIVFAIVQGLDEFRDSVPEFVARFTELKRFLLVDMVESVTVHMREQQIQEIRSQQFRGKERECQGRKYDKERSQKGLGSPIGFRGRNDRLKDEVKYSRQLAGGSKFYDGDHERFDHSDQNQEERGNKDNDWNLKNDRNGSSNFIEKTMVGALQRKESDGIGLEVDWGQSSKSKGKLLKLDTGNLWSREGQNEDTDSSGNDNARAKGKSIAEPDIEGQGGEQGQFTLLPLRNHQNIWDKSTVNFLLTGEGTSKSQEFVDEDNLPPPEVTVKSFNTSQMQPKAYEPSSAQLSQHEETSRAFDTLSKIDTPLASKPCKSCEALRAIGKEGFCWFCATKGPNGQTFEKVESGNLRPAGNNKTQNLCANEGQVSSVPPKERIGGGCYGRDKIDFEGSRGSLKRFCTLERSLGSHVYVESAKQQNFPIFSLSTEKVLTTYGCTIKSLDGQESDLLLPIESGPTSSYVSLTNLSMPATTSSECLFSKESFRQKANDSARSRKEGLWKAGRSSVASSSKVETSVQIGPLDNGGELELLRNPRELGRSRSFNSLDNLKDKEEREEIVSLEKERLAAEKARHQERQQSMLFKNNKSKEKVTATNTGKGKNVIEKVESSAFDVTDGCRRGWKAGESTAESKSELAEKYSFKKSLRADALKRREGDRAIRIGSSRNRDESRHLEEASARNRDVVTCSNDGKPEKKDDAGSLRSQNVDAAQSINEGKSEELPETSSTGFWAKQELREALGLRLVGDDSSCSDSSRLSQRLLKDSKQKQVVGEGFSYDLPSFNSSKALVSQENSSNTCNGQALEFQGALSLPSTSSSNTSQPVVRCLASLESMEVRPSILLEGTAESSDSHEEGAARPGPGRDNERKRGKEDGHFGWTRRRDHSGERLRSAGDICTERERLAQNEAAQLGVPGLEERVAERETWRETWRERVGRRVREMRRETQGQGESECDREARRERLREGVRKRQRDMEREALFFDISFWRAEQIIAHGYCLSDVSMCIATHSAKPLTPLELQILSRAALAGPLLAATVAHVNKQVGSHSL